MRIYRWNVKSPIISDILNANNSYYYILLNYIKYNQLLIYDFLFFVGRFGKSIIPDFYNSCFFY